jgi:hypothetical protein
MYLPSRRVFGPQEAKCTYRRAVSLWLCWGKALLSEELLLSEGLLLLEGLLLSEGLLLLEGPLLSEELLLLEGPSSQRGSSFKRASSP